ncbi:DrmE family protein [Nonomuraea sp. NPDC048826]|uniref:DrmE family protein n=1 Tax=Nonomuraea sp. NPDC048826 TaxID=3364347 RepID=UPI0037120AFD
MDAVPYGTADDRCPQVPLPPALGAGLSSCLLEGRLSSGGKVLEASLLDVDALRAVEYAMTCRGSVMICPADPLSPLAALLAAAAHIDAMVRNRLMVGQAGPSPLRVGVVTTDYRLRGFYRGLAVQERVGVGGVPMRAIVPAATVGANGMLSVIDSENGCWSTVFVDSIDAVRRLGELDLLIVDLPAEGTASLAEIGMPTVVVARDPADAAALRAASQMAVFGYDWAVQSGTAYHALVEGEGAVRVANRARRRVRIVPVLAPAVCDNARLFWDDIASLVRLAGRSLFVRKLVVAAFGLFHDLVGLAMPVSSYEQLCSRSLDRRIDELARGAMICSVGELRDEWLPMIEAELAGLLSALRAAERAGLADGNGYGSKASALPPLLSAGLDEGKDVLVVTRTAMLARVYREYLAQRWPLVRVASLGELEDTAPADVAVLLGMSPSWGRWVYRSGIAAELVVLAYTASNSDRQAERDIDDGFDEATIVAKAIMMQTKVGLEMSVPSQRIRACAALRSGQPMAGGFQYQDFDAVEADIDIQVSVPHPPELPPRLWDGLLWSGVEFDRIPSSKIASEVDTSELGAGLRVRFVDGTWAWLHAHSLVWRWCRSSGRTEQVEADRLDAGDQLVFIDGDAHKTLLAKVLEVAGEVPELAVATVWVEQWRAAVRRAHTVHRTYHGLHRALVKFGCRVQAQTVRLWCTGTTIGPDDPADVRRLGDLLEDRVLTTNHWEIWRAMRTLRHSHVRLGRRLTMLTRLLGPATQKGRLPSDEILDQASGLTAGDVETAVVVVRVAQIERYAAVPLIVTGQRRDADDPDEPFDTDQCGEQP